MFSLIRLQAAFPDPADAQESGLGTWHMSAGRMKDTRINPYPGVKKQHLPSAAMIMNDCAYKKGCVRLFRHTRIHLVSQLITLSNGFADAQRLFFFFPTAIPLLS